MKKTVLIMFGGVSAEHEVSIVSGLQVVEKIDRDQFDPHVIYIGKKGETWYLGQLANRKAFLTASKKVCMFGNDEKGGFVSLGGFLSKKIYPHAAFLAFHGGTGESGQWQGVLESCGIPHTGSSVEGAVIAMNKKLTKEVLAAACIQTVTGAVSCAEEIQKDSQAEARRIESHVGLPAIVKPVHLGSSIAITIVRDSNALERALIEASHVDHEILVETLVTDFVEYNASLRVKKGSIEVSPIERPVSKDEILSFADKYERGGKKQGGVKQSGMASLDREVPAQIDSALKKRIEEAATRAFVACRLRGVPRIDFMYKKSTDELFLTEVNPIPGSVAFYLWEAAGIPFTQQITDAIAQAVVDAKKDSALILDYKSEIVEKFCN